MDFEEKKKKFKWAINTIGTRLKLAEHTRFTNSKAVHLSRLQIYHENKEFNKLIWPSTNYQVGLSFNFSRYIYKYISN